MKPPKELDAIAEVKSGKTTREKEAASRYGADWMKPTVRGCPNGIILSDDGKVVFQFDYVVRLRGLCVSFKSWREAIRFVLGPMADVSCVDDLWGV